MAGGGRPGQGRRIRTTHQTNHGRTTLTARGTIVQMHDKNVRLREELTEAKKKQPDRGRAGGPPERHPNPDHFSIPHLPNYNPPDHSPLDRMKELKIGSNPVTLYFQKLEIEVKLAGQRNDMRDCGAMVMAIRQGVPASYTSIIANIGYRVPHTYDDWKDCILHMYEE